MSQLIEFLPLVAFFVAYKVYDIYAAIIAVIVAMVVMLIFTKLSGKEISKMQWASLALALVFGGMTLFFRNELFVKWKPSILNWLFAVAMLGSQFIGKKNATEHLMGKVSPNVPSKVWTQLNLSWVIVFTLVGFLNIYIAYEYSTGVWVNFKVFGILAITLTVAMTQGLYLMKFHPDTKK